jgi:hypothetical protein
MQVTQAKIARHQHLSHNLWLLAFQGNFKLEDIFRLLVAVVHHEIGFGTLILSASLPCAQCWGFQA